MAAGWDEAIWESQGRRSPTPVCRDGLEKRIGRRVEFANLRRVIDKTDTFQQTCGAKQELSSSALRFCPYTDVTLGPHPVQELVPSAPIISSSILYCVPVSIAVVIAGFGSSELSV
jgi:hypothetical protein